MYVVEEKTWRRREQKHVREESIADRSTLFHNLTITDVMGFPYGSFLVVAP